MLILRKVSNTLHFYFYYYICPAGVYQAGTGKVAAHFSIAGMRSKIRNGVPKKFAPDGVLCYTENSETGFCDVERSIGREKHGKGHRSVY